MDPMLSRRQNSPRKSNQLRWKTLGSGAYNQVWHSTPEFKLSLFLSDPSYRGPYVYKQPIEDANELFPGLNQPARAVNIVREIETAEHPSNASLYLNGWVSNYHPISRAPTDLELATELVAIYKRSGRIVFDAPTPGNALVIDDNGKTIVKIVDVDLAIKRSESPISQTYATPLIEGFKAYWQNAELCTSFPLTLNVIQNLIYFEDHIPYHFSETTAITYENISILTYGRENSLVLTRQVFQNIQDILSTGVEPAQALLHALYDMGNAPLSSPARLGLSPSPYGRRRRFFSSSDSLDSSEPSSQSVQKRGSFSPRPSEKSHDSYITPYSTPEIHAPITPQKLKSNASTVNQTNPLLSPLCARALLDDVACEEQAVKLFV